MREGWNDIAVALEPALAVVESTGSPDPDKRSAAVTFRFYGPDAIRQAWRLYEALGQAETQPA